MEKTNFSTPPLATPAIISLGSPKETRISNEKSPAAGRIYNVFFKAIFFAIPVCFFIKAGALGLFVTPLWDIPDESGHVAYVQEIVEEHQLPKKDISKIKGEIYVSWYGHEGETMNWIAQHPPLFYITSIPFYQAGKLISGDIAGATKGIRLLSALSGAIGIYFLMLLGLKVSKNKVFSIIVGMCLSFLPMYTHLSSGANHDIFLTMLCIIGVYFWYRWVESENNKDGILMGIFLALAGITKINGIALAAILIAVSFFILRPICKKRIKSFILISTISLSLPILWIIATFISSNKLPTGIARSQDPEMLMSLPSYVFGWIDFIRNTNAVDQIAKNFVGWIGWMAGGKFEIVQISPTHFVVIAIISSALLLLSLYWMINKIVNQNHKVVSIGAIAALIISIISYQAITKQPSITSFFYTSMAVVLLLSPIFFFYSHDKKEKIITGALVSSLIFTILLFQKLFDVYLTRGVPGALHGRYFFPLIPLLTIGIAYPSFKILTKHGRYWLFIPMPIILLFIELSFYLERVMPFFLTKIHYLQ